MFKILFVFLSLCSCSSLVRTNPKRNIVVDKEPMSEKSIKNFLSIIPKMSKIVQFVTYKKGERIENLQVVFKNNKSLSVTVLSLMGIELITLRVTSKGIEKVSGVPSFKLEHFQRVMTDMLAVYATRKVLYSSTLANTTIVDKPSSRDIYQKEEKIVSIKYSNVSDKWRGSIELRNHQYNYMLSVKTIEFKNEDIRK